MLDLPLWAWLVCAGVLGLLVGSFLNVVILRLPARMEALWRREAHEALGLDAGEEPLPPGIVREPSHCPHCGHRLRAFDNIPLLGWLKLKGRCRHCGARISLQYPLVEAAVAVLSVLVVARLGPGGKALAGLVFTWMLVALTGIDLRTRLLPDQLTYPLLWLGLLLSLTGLFVPAPMAILGAALGYLSLWSVYWLFKLATGKEGMGYGDFKLLAALGAWMGPGALLPVILLSSLIGALLGGALIVFGRHRREVPIPFGPFLAGAGWLWLLAGDALWGLYAQLAGWR
ncbi:prepilin peptidase [Aerosticca soli]|uniref:Prepilin leader peptidase/N-methyltransferase n=1 Tax=Aerosticca soli TaxID=2010829 RepID=A0A2Z6E693_9GAMM|nr:A24 family peptidase [Aerosticca soli]BBD80362.1 leader peptidase / N-methyltransferase [Aerosticca soli]